MTQQVGRRSLTFLLRRLSCLYSGFFIASPLILVQNSTGFASAFFPIVQVSPFSPCAALATRITSGSVARSRPSSQTVPRMVILESPSAERNKGPIWDVLISSVLPAITLEGKVPLRVLEVAAGCGVHTQHFASQLIDEGYGECLQWQPTDPEILCRDSIDSRVDTYHGNDKMISLRDCVAKASSLTLDAGGIAEIRQCGPTKKVAWEDLNLILCINMIHISPWEATVGLMKLAGSTLKKGGILYCYGPYKVDGMAVPSNLSFDQSLRSRDPSWGVRDVEEVEKEGKENGLELVQKIEMPANNLSLIFQKC